MSRRYPTAELYEERQRDFYRNGNRSNRSYDELDVELRESSRRSEHGGPRHSQPDFLREDYGRTTAGPLALRKSRTDDFDRRSVSSHSRPTRDERDIEKDEVIIRNERRSGPPPREHGSIRFQERPTGPPPPREVEKEEIIYRRREEDVESRATTRRPPPREDDVASVRTNHTKTTRGRDVDREEIIIRREESRGPPPSKAPTRESDREDIMFRRGNGPRGAPAPPPSTRGGDVERDEFIFRREEREAGPPGKRGDVERDEFIFRREERSSSPPPPPRSRRGDVEKDEVVFRREERSRGPNRREEDLTIRTRERSLPPPRLVAREREDFVLKRREQRPPSPPSPPPQAHVEKQEIIIRRTERSPSRSPSRSPTPPPPPPPEPILRPPIIQEIITHHRHIDHGVERVREPSPPPPPPSPPKEEDLEISIRRRTTDGRTYEEDISFETNRERDVKPEKRRPEKKFKEPKREVSSTEKIEINATHDDSSGDEKNFELSITRQRSQSAAAPPTREISAPRRRAYEDDIQAEADFYNRKAEERGFHGEAYNGATKDWGLVDVPPGTRRVRMDGQGGAGQEITWERYSGGRRSKFITDDGEYASDFGRGSHNHKAIAPPPPKPKEDMWTEVTKDLVIEDAIKSMGYQYEETESFYYIMEYLRYEDVLQLVELSDDIRRDRRSRIREIQWEREEIRPPPPRSGYDEHIYEREVIYDSRGRRHK